MTNRRLRSPVGCRLHLEREIRLVEIVDAEPRESVELLDDTYLVSALLVGRDHGLDGVREVAATVPAGEQIDILAGSLDEAVLLDGVAARRANPYWAAAASPICARRR